MENFAWEKSLNFSAKKYYYLPLHTHHHALLAFKLL